MDKVLVVNASPLIFLSRIERLDLLLSLTKSLIVHEQEFGTFSEETRETVVGLLSLGRG